MQRFNDLSIRAKLSWSFILIAVISTLISISIYSKVTDINHLVLILTINVILAIIMGIFVAKIISKSLKKVIHLLDELSKGHFSSRLRFNVKDEIGVMCSEIDKFAEHLNKNIVGSIKKISEGDLDFEIVKRDAKDEFAIAITKITETLKELKNESNLLVIAYTEGETNYRIDTNKFKGAYKEIVEETNKTINEIIMVVRDGYAIMQKLTEGDLTARMEKEYKGNFNWYKNYINNLGKALHKLVLEMREAINAVASSSTEITSSAEELALGSEEQSKQAGEVARAVDEMTKTIFDTTKNINIASEASRKYGEIAKDGGRVVSETINGMNRISDVVKKSAETVQQLGKSSEQIGEIIQVIDDIADQTNLLALNAAIEAARAGEQGRGFAVVADEVRKLAERTTKATKEIATMIRQIQKDTEGAVVSMNEGTNEVVRGKQLADKAGESLQQIISGADQVVNIITQVAAASEEQSSASEQISKNIEAISSVSQQGTEGVQQIAKAAEDLNHLTLNLDNLVRKFKIDNTSIKELTYSYK